MTMKGRYKVLLGGAALALASAASFPSAMNVFYPNTYPADWSKRRTGSTLHSLSALGGGEGWGEVGDSRAPAGRPTSPSHAFGAGPSLSPLKGGEGILHSSVRY